MDMKKVALKALSSTQPHTVLVGGLRLIYGSSVFNFKCMWLCHFIIVIQFVVMTRWRRMCHSVSLLSLMQQHHGRIFLCLPFWLCHLDRNQRMPRSNKHTWYSLVNSSLAALTGCNLYEAVKIAPLIHHVDPTDIDECAQSLHMCHYNQQCINTVGTYRCQAKCGAGFKPSSSGHSCEGKSLPFILVHYSIHTFIRWIKKGWDQMNHEMVVSQ